MGPRSVRLWDEVVPEAERLQRSQQFLHKLERTPCVDGSFVRGGRIVENRELFRPIVVYGLELLPQDF